MVAFSVANYNNNVVNKKKIEKCCVKRGGNKYSAAKWLDDNNTIITSSWNSQRNYITKWNKETNEIKHVISYGFENDFYQICYYGGNVFSAGSDGKVRSHKFQVVPHNLGARGICNVTESQNYCTMFDHNHGACFCVAAFGNTVISGGRDGYVCVYDSSTGSVQRKTEKDCDSIKDVCFVNDNNTFASIGCDAIISIWDSRAKVKAFTCSSGFGNMATCLAVNKKNKTTIAVGVADGLVAVYDVRNTNEAMFHCNAGKRISHIEFDAVDSALYFSAENSIFRVAFEENAQAIVSELYNTILPINSFDIENSSTMAVASDSNISVLHITDQQP